MTNGDWVRSMTDEQLSVFLRMGACQLCAYAGKNYDCCCPDNKNCRNGHLEWLKQEHKEYGND
jgi:hypothetical protein